LKRENVFSNFSLISEFSFTNTIVSRLISTTEILRTAFLEGHSPAPRCHSPAVLLYGGPVAQSSDQSISNTTWYVSAITYSSFRVA
jgi:hypothetical protein